LRESPVVLDYRSACPFKSRVSQKLRKLRRRKVKNSEIGGEAERKGDWDLEKGRA
jgi:hypothetical protein